MARVKGFYKKISANENNAYSDFYPFGTDGELVDILSGLNLEDELRLGGMRDCIIEESNDGDITYTQRYYKENNDPNAQSRKELLFSIDITIPRAFIYEDLIADNNDITISYYDSNSNLIKTKFLNIGYNNGEYQGLETFWEVI